MRRWPKIEHQPGAVTGKTLPVGPSHAAKHDPIRALPPQLCSKLLRHFLAVRIVEKSEGGIISAHVVKVGIEVREILPSPDCRIEDADFSELLGPLIGRFG